VCSTADSDALAVIERGLDMLAAAEPPVGDAARLDRVRRLTVVANRVTALQAAAVRAAENHQAAEHDGLKSMKSWLRTHCRLPGTAVTGLVRQGRAMAYLPAVERAFLAGEITAAAVDAIAVIATPENLDRAAAQDIDLAVIEQAFVTIATTQPHTKLQAAVGAYLARLDPDGTEPDPTEQRSLSLVQHPDGTVTGGLTLDQIGGEKVMTTLESLAAKSRCAGDVRTRAQRLADALVQLCDLALASGELPVLRTVKPHVVIRIDDKDLFDPHTGHGAGTTGTGALISAARARWAACDANVTRIVLDPDGLPLDVGRQQRVVPPHLRRAVEIRDQGCVFAGCEAPTWWCDVHHLVEWINGGETSLDNSGLLCERHHIKIHHGYRVERDDDAPPERRWRTYRPDGTEILVAPPLTAA
jgi:hypothetical protein